MEADLIVSLQTADLDRYFPLLMITAEVNKLYCKLHNFEYRQFIGIKRGYFPWHATFNRIVMLKEMIDTGFRGWVFYLDADAYIVELSYKIQTIINEVSKPVIMAPGGLSGAYWDVNSGVFLINLGEQISRDLALAWHADFMSTSDVQLRGAPEWRMVPSDQERLQRILREDQRFSDCVGRANRKIFNDRSGSFIRQALRADSNSWEERLSKVRKETSAVLNGIPIA